SFGTVTVQPGNVGDDCGAGAGNTFTLTGNTFTCAVSRLDQGIAHTFTVKGTPTITGTNTSGSVQLNAALTAVSTYSESNPGDENSSGSASITPVADLSTSVAPATQIVDGGTANAGWTVTVSDVSGNSIFHSKLTGTLTFTNSTLSSPVINPSTV